MERRPSPGVRGPGSEPPTTCPRMMGLRATPQETPRNELPCLVPGRFLLRGGMWVPRKRKTRLCLALNSGPLSSRPVWLLANWANAIEDALIPGESKTRAKHRRVLRIGRPQAGSSRNVTASGGRGSKGGAASQSRRPHIKYHPTTPGAWLPSQRREARSRQ